MFHITANTYTRNYVFSVSNEVPEHPVVSPVSGSIFEKRLIEKYVTENGVDPITGKELTIEQLIDIKSMPHRFYPAIYYHRSLGKIRVSTSPQLLP